MHNADSELTGLLENFGRRDEKEISVFDLCEKIHEFDVGA
jgi:hypothetical protein